MVFPQHPASRLLVTNNASGNSAFGPEFGFDLRTSGTFTTAAAATLEPFSCLLVWGQLDSGAAVEPSRDV